VSGSQVVAGVFAVVSLAVSVLAIWRVANASGVKYRALWILGSLCGFAGVATRLDAADDLYLQFGMQIPVLMWMTGSGGSVLKASFPFLAAVALVKFHPSGSREMIQAEAAEFD